MDAQRRTAPFFVTQGVGFASCMFDWGIYQHSQERGLQGMRSGMRYEI